MADNANRPRILVVDDEPSIAHAIQMFLEDQGCDVVTAGSAEEGLSRLAEGEVAVALLDIVLPGMNGLQLLREIKSASPDTEVVMMTSHASIETTIKAIREGAYDYLQKPFDEIDEVWLTVRRALERRDLTVRNRELFKEQEVRNAELSAAVRRLSSLNDAGRAMSESRSIEELFSLLLGLVSEQLASERVSLMLLDQPASELRIVAARGLGTIDFSRVRIPLGQGIAGTVASTGKSIRVTDVNTDPLTRDTARPELSDSFISAPIRLSVPIKVRERVLGVINVTNRVSGAPYGPDDEAYLAGMTGQLAVAIERATFYTELKAEEEHAAELRAARDAADAANHAKSEFLARMSHEIRTPINGMLGFAQLLRHTELDTRQSRHVEGMLRSGGILLGIIEDILDFSKIEAGKLSLECKDFDVREVVESTVELLAKNAGDKELEIICNVPIETITAVQGDPKRLQQVLANLVGNAIKFTEAGEIVVELSSLDATDEDVTLIASVRDTGIGLSPEMRERVFEAFHQADGYRYGGTGLGLAIAKELAELMGGEIGVESSPGEGARFWFTARFRRQRARGSRFDLLKPKLEGRRVLIVDRNATRRRILTEEVSCLGMIADTAEDSPGAMEALRAARAHGFGYDLAVLVDSGAAGNGAALWPIAGAGPTRSGAVGAEPAIPGIPMIVVGTEVGPSVSAGGGNGDGGSAPVWRIGKPLLPSELFSCMATALGAQESANANTETDARADAGAGADEPRRTPHVASRILLAEDNAINRMVAVEMLELMGCQIDVVESGEAAVEAVEAGGYDLVLMDCQMPGIDGLEATRRIRCAESARATPTRVPIVALTAHAVEGNREECLRAGMDDFLAKPFEMEALRETIGRLLGADAANAAADGEIHESPPTRVPLPSAAAGVLDEGALAKLQRIGSDMFERAVTDYLEQAPVLIDNLMHAIEENDSSAVAFSAHALKSDSAWLGASALVPLLQSLEDMGNRENLSGAAEIIRTIGAEHGKVHEALKCLAGRAGS